MSEFSWESWSERIAQRYREEAEQGLHDDECEYHVEGFYLCHCAKRRRIASGLVEPLGELIFQSPLCPNCYEETVFEDGYRCYKCSTSWPDQFGNPGTFDDDYGDNLKEDSAKWLEHHNRKKAESS